MGWADSTSETAHSRLLPERVAGAWMAGSSPAMTLGWQRRKPYLRLGRATHHRPGSGRLPGVRGCRRGLALHCVPIGLRRGRGRGARVNLKFLETFVWVARLKSFSLAAERLHTTQAAASHRIATLERELGVRLFERGARELCLTPLGADAREEAERIVRLAADFRRRLSDPRSLAGTLRIGVIDTVVYTWLPRLIDQVAQTYPEVVLELTAAISPEIAADILEGRLDLGLMNGPADAPGLVNRELCSFACRWVASPRLEVPERPLEIEEIARFPILSFPTDSSRHGSVVSYFRRSGIEKVRLHTASLATLIRLTVDGLGLAAIPIAAIERELAAGELRVLPARKEFPAIALYAMYLELLERPLPALIAQMAADCAADFCRRRDPAVAW